MNAPRRGPIFIVGTGRSGTTLLASLLDRHSAIACGPETAIFSMFSLNEHRAILADKAWPDEAVRAIGSLAYERAGPILAAYGLTTDDVRAELRGTEPSLRALLEAIVVPHARRAGKRRWAEKTPMHLLKVEEIRALWPDASIIRMVRDPRGVAASLTRVPFGTRSAVGAAYVWRRQQDATAEFFARDRGSLTVRYEDLLRGPERTVRELCAFIGEDFEPGMLDSATPSGAIAPGEEWKWRARTGIDASRADAWRIELSSIDQKRVALVCAKHMAALGYRGGLASRTIRVNLFDAEMSDDPRLAEVAADAGMDIEPSRADDVLGAPLPDLFWGGASKLHWSRRTRSETFRGVLRLWLRLARARLMGRPVRWAGPRLVARHSPRLERVADWAVRLLALEMPVEDLPAWLTGRGEGRATPSTREEQPDERESAASFKPAR